MGGEPASLSLDSGVQAKLTNELGRDRFPKTFESFLSARCFCWPAMLGRLVTRSPGQAMNRFAFALLPAFWMSLSMGSLLNAADDSEPSQFRANPKGASPENPVDIFYQQVDIQRFPRFLLQGMSVNQQIRCRVTSQFRVQPADEHGKRTAVQVITDAKLVEGDPLSQAVFIQSLAAMVGREYTYVIDSFSEVTSMAGHEENREAIEFRKPKTQGVFVSSLIDKDGWRELAQLTLFQPPVYSRTRRRSGRSFVRKTTHDWGSLGSWYGKTTFTGRPSGRDTKHFQFQHELEYRSPDQGDRGIDKQAPPKAAADTDLPFEIVQAQFKMYEGWGEIDYNTKEDRVTRAREVFHARGSIAAKMLGLPTKISLDEKQVFTITITAAKKLRVPGSLTPGVSDD